MIKRYALTFAIDDGFRETDTIIVEVDTPKDYAWGEDQKEIVEALKAFGLHKVDIEYVLAERSYFVRNVDDIDIDLKLQGE